MRRLRHLLVRFAAVWIIEALSLYAMTLFIPGIAITDSASVRSIDVAMAAALVLGIINVLVRPLLLLLTLTINVLTLGVSTLVINALMIGLTAYLLPGFEVSGLLPALLGALVLAAVNTVITRFTTIDDDYSFYESIVERLSLRQRIADVAEPSRGLVMLEIDGLSHDRLLRAVDLGLMPTVREMLKTGSHAASRFDCGLPSQTSACQAGILYGDNHDIPAFRWFDKQRGKLIVSNNFRDAAELNARYATGHGLLRGGSSINNLLSGDAARTLLTLSDLGGNIADAGRRRQEDLYLFYLNPYIFTRSFVLTLWDILLELGQALRQRLRDVRPRVNRLHKGYPFLRAITNVLLRDLATSMVALDVIRGAPAVYTTYVGYDEVAHYAGPDTSDAMNTLRALDTQIRRVRDLIAHKAPRPYDLFVLSDHGQSVGATFRQRSGETLAQLIDRLVAPETRVEEMSTTISGASYTAALAAELRGVQQATAPGRIGRAALSRASRSLESRAERHAASAVPKDAEVTVCASGNLANVYCQLGDGKITLDELNAVYPGLVDALVAHPDLGFVVAHGEVDRPVALGKHGARDLWSGAVRGSDPLEPFGDAQLRASQLLRLAQYPHAGDLIINSALYPDGQVAAFEELVGSHGGIGGPQTDAFLLHPADMTVPPISNSSEVFALLDARRGLAVAPRPHPTLAPPTVDAWAPTTLWIGLRNWRKWGSRAVGALRLERGVFRDVARDEYATGPALFILALALGVQAFVARLNPIFPGLPTDRVSNNLIVGTIGWIAVVMVAHYAGRWLGGRGRLTFTFRAMSFALIPQWLGPLRLLPGLGSLFGSVLTLASVVGAWIALQEALELRTRRMLLVPFASVLIALISFVVLSLIAGGIEISVEAMLLQLGIVPGA